MENSANYREKYIKCLDEQERLEKQTAFQIEQMRKTLVHVSTAAQGLDKTLDSQLLVLREKMRGASGAQVIEQMELVQKAVTEFERRRVQEHSHAVTAATSLLREYRKLNVPKSIRIGLQSFEQSLKNRLQSFRQYPAVFEELSKLQTLAFDASLAPEQSLWQRLRGGRALSSANSCGELAATKTDSSVIDASETSTGELILADDGDEAASTRIDISRFALEGEDDYHKVAERIAATLQNLIDRIEPNDLVKHKVDIVRLRIERGMDWFVLAVTLEDIRDILLLRYLESDREFGQYLHDVNQQLQAIGEILGLAVDREQAQQQAVAKFSGDLSQRMVSMRDTLQGASNIDTLKSEVSTHISEIQDALKNIDKHNVSDESLSEQLQSLLEKVKNAENESAKTKEQLRQQRHKATHDALTSLPNREAYNERAFAEMQRYQRYKHPLTLAVCDIDLFKKINDNYGHQAGDKVLQMMAKVIAGRLREVDFVARYGGEEFVLLMPETDQHQAFKVLDKIRAAIAKTPFRFKDAPVKITLSFGICQFAGDDNVERVFERADKALYKAKEQGRNRCEIADHEA